MDSGFQWSFCFNFHDVSRMLHDCFCSVRVYTVFCDSLCAIVLQSVRFFRRKAFVVSWYTFVVVSSFRTILSSSNGNICYSLYTLSVVVVGFCFTLVTVGLSFFFLVVDCCLPFVGLFSIRSFWFQSRDFVSLEMSV